MSVIENNKYYVIIVNYEQQKMHLMSLQLIYMSVS